MNLSDGEFICEIRRLYDDMNNVQILTENDTHAFRARYRALSDFAVSTRPIDASPNFLPLVEARLEQLESLLKLMAFTPNIKTLRVPPVARTSDWSLMSLRKFVEFARHQAGILQRVQSRVVPEAALVELRSKHMQAMGNYMRLQNLYQDVRASRLERKHVEDEPTRTLPGSSLLKILTLVRKQYPSFAAYSDDSVVAISKNEIVYVNSTAMQKMADAKLVTDTSRKAYDRNTVKKKLREALALPPESELKWPESANDSVPTSINKYNEDFFIRPLTTEKTRFYSAVMQWLRRFSEILQLDFDNWYMNFSTNKTQETKAEREARAERLLTRLGGLAGGALVLGGAGTLAVGAAAAAAAFALPAVGLPIYKFGAFLYSRLKGEGKEADIAPEAVPQVRDLETGLYPGTFTEQQLASLEGISHMDDVKKKKQNPNQDVDRVDVYDLLITGENANKLSHAWMFSPLALARFLQGMEDFVTGDAPAPLEQLGMLFAGFYSLTPDDVEMRKNKVPLLNLLNRIATAPKPIKVGSPQLLRHWYSKSLDHAVQYARNKWVKLEQELQELQEDRIERFIGCAIALAKLGSDYMYVARVRRVLGQLKSTPAPQPEDLEVLLVDALRREYARDENGDLIAEFEQARLAFTSFSAWALPNSPNSSHFQARPCDLLRVRGLDLSLIPELHDYKRGVRVFLPLDVKPGPSYLTIAQQTMPPYLVSILKSSAVFTQLWKETIDTYVARTEARRAFTQQCERGPEETSDLSFD